MILCHDLCADRHLDHHVRRVGSGPVRACAIAALLRPEVLRVAKVDQRVQVGHGLEDDISAFAAVAAVGPAEFDEFLPPERAHAVAAVSGFQVDLGLVEKMHGGRLAREGLRVQRSSPAGGGGNAKTLTEGAPYRTQRLGRAPSTILRMVPLPVPGRIFRPRAMIPAAPPPWPGRNAGGGSP